MRCLTAAHLPNYSRDAPLFHAGSNVDKFGFTGRGLTFTTTAAGLVVLNQSTPAIAIKTATPIAASPFMTTSWKSRLANMALGCGACALVSKKPTR
jgi:hypothetical protein